jgi:hypothetical protein
LPGWSAPFTQTTRIGHAFELRKALRKRTTLEGLWWKALREEGRK